MTTLVNPELVEDIRHHGQAEKVARGEMPRELSAQEIGEITAFGREAWRLKGDGEDG